MFRYFGLTIFGLAAVAILNAGQIQIGGTAGLTTAYMTGSSCAGSTASYINSASFGGCTTGGPSGTAGTNGVIFKNQTFTGGLFNGTSVGAPPTTLNNVVDANGNDVNFDLGSNTGQWNGAGGVSTTVSLTVPVGVFDVDTAWTLLEDYYGASGAQNTTVIFQFGTSSSGGINSADTLTFNLTNGNQIGSAYNNCAPVTGPCPSDPAATIGSGFTTNSASGTTVAWGSSSTTAYANDTAANAWMGTSGYVALDDQVFNLTGGSRSSEWLVDMVIENTGGQNAAGAYTSKTSLDAITIDAAPVPEPSTVWLFATGLGALGLSRFRRRNRA